jgi:diguanylate cyclase (GGDEF)-like protein/PAS domain S-box-containing protein
MNLSITDAETPLAGNILIVDDTPANLRLLSDMLVKQGHKVRTAPDGSLALISAQAIPPDLILLDIKMPGLSGYEVCEQLKADPRTRDIPVIFISALDQTEDKVKAFTFGGVDYITKPFQIEEVLARAETQLALHTLQQQLATANEELKESEALYRSVSEMANDGIGIMAQGMITFCNSSFAKMIGREIDEVLGQPFSTFLHPDSLPEVMEDYQKVLAGEEITPRREFTVVKKKGDVVTIEVSASVLEDPPNLRVLLIGRDITEQKRLEDQLHQLAITDPLTGISNRRHFFNLAEKELARARRYKRPISAVMIDLDTFKQINDQYGHLVGDQVLQAVAKRVRDCVREVDIPVRYGGEEFVILMPDTDLANAAKMAERLCVEINSQPIKTNDKPVSVTISLGVASCEVGQEITIDTLLDWVDQAMYAAKREGRNRVALYQKQ